MKLIDKDALVTEIERRIEHNTEWKNACKTIAVLAANQAIEEDKKILSIIDTLEVVDPYEQCIQYASIESGIKAHAENYSFNIESVLFQQLSKEQQKLWRKEIEQACISGGYCGLNLGLDKRYDKEEPVSDFEMALAEMIDKAQKCVVEPWAIAAQWKDELIKLAKSEESVSGDLGEASKEWLAQQLDKSYANYGEAKMMELTKFDGYAMLDAIEFGAKWQFERVKEALLSEVLPCFMHGGEAEEVMAKLDEVLNQK